MNHKTVILFCFLLFVERPTYAGDPVYSASDKCGTIAHMQYLKSLNPDFEKQFQLDEQKLSKLENEMSIARQFTSVYTIPVVVHVVYKTAGENISDAQIQSQIDVLNEDFGRYNADTTNTPAAFRTLASATSFQFCLARRDPNGNASSGIERRQNNAVSTWSQNDDVKHYSTGGLDAWDVSSYMNIWVCNLGNTLLGYGEYPASVHTNTYGVVIQYDAFGRTGNVSYPYNKGRTCTHEISHCFRLSHIWGDDGGLCLANGGGSDFVGDTPDQGDKNYGCQTYPLTDACTPANPGIMFMNYMDYSDDRCLNMFTAGQASRMFNAITAYYSSLKSVAPTGCQNVIGIAETVSDFQFSLYPNPSSGVINLDMSLTRYLGEQIKINAYNTLGESVFEKLVSYPLGHILDIDLSGQPTGIYFMKVSNDHFSKTVRISLNR